MKLSLLALDVAITTVLLVGCAFPDINADEKQMMDSWLGHYKAEVIRSWGPPDRITEDGANGQVIVYHHRFRFDNSIMVRRRMFYVKPDGLIYQWMADGYREQ